MFFPWGKDQKLLADQSAFDHAPYERMKQYAPDFEVKLWDFHATEKLCAEFYPDIWRVALSLPRPMMLVNTLRWLMVYHHGGISWQYDMNPLRPMSAYLPSADKQCRVFTEFEHDEAGRRLKIHEPILEGKPEESIRIPSQVFSAVPRHRYMKSVVDFIHERSKKYTFKRDYDCQFITGNAAASTAYDLFGKNDPTVERVGFVETRQMIKIIYQGTWRTEKAEVRGQKSEDGGQKAEGGRLKVEARDTGFGIRDARKILASAIKSLPGYYWVKPHLHEVAFRELRKQDGEIQHSTSKPETRLVRRSPEGEDGTPEHRIPNPASRIPSARGGSAFGGHLESRSVCSIDPGVVDAVASLIRERGFRAVLNYPEAHLPGLKEKLGEGVAYVGGDMVRGTGSVWMNLLHSRIPRVDVVIMRNFLDHIGTADAQEILQRLRAARVQFIISSHYPCLNVNWDNFAGEWRPLSLSLTPYSLAGPDGVVDDDDRMNRTDRCLALFRI